MTKLVTLVHRGALIVALVAGMSGCMAQSSGAGFGTPFGEHRYFSDYSPGGLTIFARFEVHWQ